jgi:hypothetical protein
VIRLALRGEHAGVAHRALHALVDRAELRPVQHAVQREQRDRERDRALDERRAALGVPVHELQPKAVSDFVPEYGRIGTEFHQPVKALNSS